MRTRTNQVIKLKQLEEKLEIVEKKQGFIFYVCVLNFLLAATALLLSM